MNPNDYIIRCNLRVHMVYSITVWIFPSLFDDISIDVCLTTANSCKTYRINYIRWLPSGAETCRALRALLAEDPEVRGGDNMWPCCLFLKGSRCRICCKE